MNIHAGAALVAFFSLADEAQAATCARMVASNEGVMAYVAVTLLVGIALGYIICWWLTAPRVSDADDEAYGDLPHVPHVIEIGSRRARS